MWAAVNTAIMRTVDVSTPSPRCCSRSRFSGALGAGIVNSIVSLTIVVRAADHRVAESVTTGVRNMDFVEAARASAPGASPHARAYAAMCWPDFRLRHRPISVR